MPKLKRIILSNFQTKKLIFFLYIYEKIEIGQISSLLFLTRIDFQIAGQQFYSVMQTIIFWQLLCYFTSWKKAIKEVDIKVLCKFFTSGFWLVSDLIFERHF